MDKNRFENSTEDVDKALIQQVINMSQEEIYRVEEDDITKRAKLINFVIEKLGVKNNKGRMQYLKIKIFKIDDEIVRQIYNFCKWCDWNFDDIKKYVIDFNRLEEPLYRRHIEEGKKKNSEESSIVFDNFSIYFRLINEKKEGKISEEVFEEVLDATITYGFSISDTLKTWKSINKLENEIFYLQIEKYHKKNQDELDDEVNRLKQELFRHMIEIAGVTRYSNPSDVFNIFGNTSFGVKRKVKFLFIDKVVKERIKEVLKDYNDALNSAITEYEKLPENQNLNPKELKKRIERFSKKYREDFIIHWKENPELEEPGIKLDEYRYATLESVLDEKNESVLDEKKSAKLRRAKVISLEVIGINGFGRNYKRFQDFYEDIMLDLKPHHFDKREKRDLVDKYFETVLNKRPVNDTIYELFSLYICEEHELNELRKKFDTEANNGRLYKLGKRVLIGAAAIMLAFGVGKFSSSKQPKEAIETTVKDDSTADSNGGQGGDSGEERLENPISEEEKNRMKEFRNSMQPPQEGEIPSEEEYTEEEYTDVQKYLEDPSEEFEEYGEDEQNDGTAQDYEVSDEVINEEENDEYIEY